MRALAASFVTIDNKTGLPLTRENGQELRTPLSGKIEVEAVYIDHRFHDADGVIGSKIKRSHNNYIAKANGNFIAESTSLHRAKNAIRRHFGIESRKMLRWEEVSR